MSSYSPRKGSLGFSFKRIKTKTIEGGNKVYLWFHKVGMDHCIQQSHYVPRTYLELIPSKIEGPKSDSKSLEDEKVDLQDTKSVVTKTMTLSPRFQKKELYKEVSSKMQLEKAMGKLKRHGTKIKITGVTKGKGFSGVIKTRGIKLGKRKRARANKQRHIGAIGGRTGHVSWRAPQAANMGSAKRTYVVTTTKYDPTNLTRPFFRYGQIKNEVICIRGSIPGNIKSIVRVCLGK